MMMVRAFTQRGHRSTKAAVYSEAKERSRMKTSLKQNEKPGSKEEKT